ncbi:MAG: ArsR family transcriptional regulator [Microbacteriaceae bacterium]|jgi:ArsR family transcriptional regulator|nr:ArsR family transcriptional regulator [Microbacteriaceae bacterium]HEV7955900.1 metalloregulator ArsR/SmtB family transcription factor [Marisediminicola sp.]
MADIFDVIADATRRDLLRALLDRFISSGSETGELSVGEMVEKLGLSQPTVSKHLKVLREIGLVTVREMGQHRFYSLDPAPLETMDDWLVPFLSADFDQDDGGAQAFTAWSGSGLPASSRRASEAGTSEAGTSIGRGAADASHRIRAFARGAASGMRHGVVGPIKRVLGR